MLHVSISPAIVITDGLSNVNAEQTIPEAELARKQGIHIFAIGVGVSDSWELNAIASQPPERNTFLVNQFSELWNISEKLIDGTCKGNNSCRLFRFVRRVICFYLSAGRLYTCTRFAMVCCVTVKQHFHDCRCLCVSDAGVCSPSPCRNGGTCIPGVGTYTCECRAGFLGKNCEQGKILHLL
jgi:collagen type VI alpha